MSPEYMALIREVFSDTEFRGLDGIPATVIDAEFSIVENAEPLPAPQLDTAQAAGVDCLAVKLCPADGAFPPHARAPSAFSAIMQMLAWIAGSSLLAALFGLEWWFIAKLSRNRREHDAADRPRPVEPLNFDGPFFLW